MLTADSFKWSVTKNIIKNMSGFHHSTVLTLIMFWTAVSNGMSCLRFLIFQVLPCLNKSAFLLLSNNYDSWALHQNLQMFWRCPYQQRLGHEFQTHSIGRAFLIADSMNWFNSPGQGSTNGCLFMNNLVSSLAVKRIPHKSMLIS